MKSKVLLTALGLLCLCSLSSPGEIISLTPVEDAYVDSANPAENFGTSDTLSIQGMPSGPLPQSLMQSYLKYDLSELPPAESITMATFGIWLYSINAPLPIASEDPMSVLYYVDDNNWTEELLTASNAPAAGSQIGTPVSTTIGTGEQPKLFTWEVTDEVLAVLNSLQETAHISFQMNVEMDDIYNGANFYSRDYSDVQLRPFLDITYQAIPEPITLGLLGLGIPFALRKKQ